MSIQLKKVRIPFVQKPLFKTDVGYQIPSSMVLEYKGRKNAWKA